MFIAPRCVQMAGVGMLFVPLNNAAYLYLARNQVNNATGLFNMLRNEGGSLEIAIVTVVSDRRTQFHQMRLAEHVTPLSPALDRWTDYFHRPGWSAAVSRGPWRSSRAWACRRRWSKNRPG